MSSTNQYLEFVLDLLGELDDVAHRKMMGEYVLYYRGKVIGGIYDDRFLLKVTPASERLLPDAPRATPYGERRRCSSSRWRTATRCATWSRPCGRSYPHRRRERKSRRGPGLVDRGTRPGPGHASTLKRVTLVLRARSRGCGDAAGRSLRRRRR